MMVLMLRQLTALNMQHSVRQPPQKLITMSAFMQFHSRVAKGVSD